MITTKRFAKTGSALLLAAWIALGQAPKLEFEVPSIKPAQPIASQTAAGKLHLGTQVDGARVDIGNLPLADLISMAYNVKPYQLSGPDWMSADRFDVIGKMPEGATKEQVPEMLQALLADRFKLTIHRENRERAVYALVVGKGGPKLKEAVPDPDAQPEGDDAKKGIATGSVRQDSTGAVVQGGGRAGKTRMTPGPDGSMRLEASSMPMAALADALSRFTDRPVVDMTELKGNYQVMFNISMAELMKVTRAAGISGGMQAAPANASIADAASDPSPSTIFTSIQQLGLKMEPRKTPVETIVIDRLEKTPTEN